MNDHTVKPHFPQDLENYAPWVAQYGLLYPYGDCQCGCGQKVIVSRKTNSTKGWVKGMPRRYINYHFRSGYIPTRPPRYESVEESFWARCTALDPSECWEWQGHISHSGYGTLYHRDLVLSTHRVSYELHKGDIPEGMFVCHTCDNRKCCNPSHLWLGTIMDNFNDMMQKGRHSKGETNGRPKLTAQDVIEIRKLYSQRVKAGKIAYRYGVHSGTIHGIVKRRTWKHIP